MCLSVSVSECVCVCEREWFVSDLLSWTEASQRERYNLERSPTAIEVYKTSSAAHSIYYILSMEQTHAMCGRWTYVIHNARVGSIKSIDLIDIDLID